MTEELLDPEESQLAAKIVDILIANGYPQDSAWVDNFRALQTTLANMWHTKRNVVIHCLHRLYGIIADNSNKFSPAVWCVLDLVDKEKITDFVEGIFNNESTNEIKRVHNALFAIIVGICQIGPSVPRLKDWAFAIIRGLEERKQFSVLVEVSESVIHRLLQRIRLTKFRPLVYPLIKQFLYSVVVPSVFYRILDDVPDTIEILGRNVSDEDHYLSDFSGLIKTLLIRFPPPTARIKAKYNLINTSLSNVKPGFFDTDSMILWNPDQDRGSWDYEFESTAPTYDEPRLPTPFKGLTNQGNTCFMNSVLQVLYMTTRFRNELLEKEIDPSERAASDLQQLFAFMQASNRSVLVPNEVMKSTLPPTFRRGHQQDSSEYLIYLLDTLHENESKIIRRKKQLSALQEASYDKKKEGNGDFEEGAASLKYSEPEKTVVERLFGGMTTSTTTCSVCNKSFPKTDHFRDLHLSVPDDYKVCDLQELINTSLEPEELYSENMYDCENCGTKREAVRKHSIVIAPEHLILTIKLFRFDPIRKQRLKLHSRLKSTKSIELPVNSNSNSVQAKRIMYDLKGVVLHAGSSLDGGHYFSSAVDQSGQWHLFNDSSVSVSKLEWNSFVGTPYILLLRQSHVCDPPVGQLPSNLQQMVNRDNQRYLAEQRYLRRITDRKKGYGDDDDDDEDSPPNNGSFGGQGPSLVC